MKQLLLSASLLLAFQFLLAQDDLLSQLAAEQKPAREYVAYTFKATRVINGHSIETCKKNAMDFRVVHRFGDMATKETNIHSLFGIDAAADIAILLEYGITNDLTIGVGRMKGNGPLRELWNASLKYRVMKQTTDNKLPLSITLYGNAVVSGMKSSTATTDINYFPKGYQGASARFSYTLQAMFARKFNRWLSVQISPIFIWRNRVAYNDNNWMVALGFQARAKLTKRVAIVWEYFLPLQQSGIGGREYVPMIRGKKDASYYPPLHLAVEIETGGHVFDIGFTNSRGLLEQDFIPYNTANWVQGQFRFGFTISRMFQVGGKKGKSGYKSREEAEEPKKEKSK